MLPYAPGARVVIRDEEWLVRRVDPASCGGVVLACDGVSELVRGRAALFLSALEARIEVLDPAATELVADPSSQFASSFLYLEAQLRRSTPNDAQIRLGHRAVMNLVPYQLDPALQALRQPRSRILIADAVGLGKTLEAGILATELIQRGRGTRMLVVTLKSMLAQFQKEFWSRFSIPLVRLDSLGLQRVRNVIPSNHNPFNYYDRTIISIDTLKGSLEYRNYLESAWWDIIVIDECHNVAARAGEDAMSRRARLARLLASRSDTLILLSATPHDGSARSFASLMGLLDPTAISDPDDYTPADFRDKGLVVRRFKKDIRDQVSADFQERVTVCLREPASAAEDAACRALLAIAFTQRGQTQAGQTQASQTQAGRPQELQRVGMQKALFSSPAAALDSTQRRIDRLRAGSDLTAAEAEEVAALQTFADALRRIDATRFSKFQRLIRHLGGAEFAWQPGDPADRLVIFSERIETLGWLAGHLPAATRLRREQIEILHGGLGDTEQQAIVERFGRREAAVRVLLCSDVAAEGLNLHYFCHRLVHFDLPWSLMVFQQRNGRVDRYGQTRRPQIVYLFTETAVERIRGDLRILEVLQEKDEQANRNLGDPAAFLHVYDPEQEADKVAGLMAAGTTPEQFAAGLDAAATREDANDGDWLLRLFADAAPAPAPAPATATPATSIDAGLTLFGRDAHAAAGDSDYRYAQTALEQLSRPQPIAQFTTDDAARSLTLTAPPDLQERLRRVLPIEVRARDHRYTLCADAGRIAEAIETARQADRDEESWPALHYLWPQHPVMDWLSDRVLTAFGRHRAPVIRCAALDPDERAFVLMGRVPNRKGQPLLIEWQVASARGEAAQASDWTLQAFPGFVARTGLRAGALPNRGQAFDPAPLQRSLAGAVEAMRGHMIARQQRFAADMDARLAGQLAELERLQDRQLEQLELRLAEPPQRARRERRSQQIRKVFDEYRQWVEDSMTTEPQPFIQVLAAVTR